MPITFGAVGDIISVCLLVKDLVQALDKARGSKAEYQSAIRELWILDRALLEIDLLARVHEKGATPELQGLCATAIEAVTRCKTLVDAFLQRIRRYQSSLGEGVDMNMMHQAATKVRWRIGEKEALDQFRVEIAGISSSLQMLLATASVTLQSVSRKELNDKLDEAEKQNKLAVCSQRALLCNIQSRIGHACQAIYDGNSMLIKITDALRLEWLQQLGFELKSLLYRAIAINIATYQAVVSSQAPLPSHLERGLIDAPFILEDAIGRTAPVHLQFVTSWEAFDAVLEIRFRGLQGHKKVTRKHYVLREHVHGREVERSRTWQGAFLPGQLIEMSMIFRDTRIATTSSNIVTCPGCSTPATRPADVDVQCTNCLIWYRRITVMEELFSQTAALEPSHRITPGSKPSRGSSIPEGKECIFEDDEDDEDTADVRDFKRVRILSTARREAQDRSPVNLSRSARAERSHLRIDTSVQEDGDADSESSMFSDKPEAVQSRVITPSAAENIILNIYRNLDHFDDIFATALVNNGFYRVFKRHEPDLIQRVWKSMLPMGPELPIDYYLGGDDPCPLFSALTGAVPFWCSQPHVPGGVEHLPLRTIDDPPTPTASPPTYDKNEMVRVHIVDAMKVYKR